MTYLEYGTCVEVAAVRHRLSLIRCWAADDEITEPIYTLVERAVVVRPRV